MQPQSDGELPPRSQAVAGGVLQTGKLFVRSPPEPLRSSQSVATRLWLLTAGGPAARKEKAILGGGGGDGGVSPDPCVVPPAALSQIDQCSVCDTRSYMPVRAWGEGEVR